ncbi:polyketide cyclase [Tessaracoccus sp. HDW20]|uniref:SRPBCC domain-containing protein n=1 Tax=Tessaracoccus coleopterorum TaxID=2714950 RepID=UPI0018D3B71C|nr:SRPBCC domain-containing protein [Tessaracoccus coleopterorum]NHB85704.1 polyketide cyclase [Tessaracoccus coleopterorum]
MSTTTTTRYRQAAIEAVEDRPIIRITRDFRATPAQLLKAHIDPQIFARWNGPDDLTNEIIEWDARDGGSWRYTHRRGDDAYSFRGCFHTVREDRIVQTFTWEGMPDEVSLETIRFEDLGGGITRLIGESLCDTFEGRDAWLASGMETGVQQGYDKLEALLPEVDA